MAFGSLLQRLLRINAATPYSWTLPSADAVGALCSDGAGTISFQSLGQMCHGRLTLTTGTPVTTADVSGVANVFFAPYAGNRIALYDGSATWNVRTFVEITVSLAGLTASRLYDIFAYDNAGTVTIETLIWTNDTTRATALTTQNGVLVKSGATTRRYLGTVYINSSGAQTDDAEAKRYLFNYYNRVRRSLRKTDSTASWTYSTATWRQARAQAANQVEVCIGWSEDAIELGVFSNWGNSNIGVNAAVGIGVDSTTTPNTASSMIQYGQSQVAALINAASAHYRGYPGVGWHKLVWLEISDATPTTTFVSGAGTHSNQSGLLGTILN